MQTLYHTFYANGGREGVFFVVARQWVFGLATDGRGMKGMGLKTLT